MGVCVYIQVIGTVYGVAHAWVSFKILLNYILIEHVEHEYYIVCVLYYYYNN